MPPKTKPGAKTDEVDMSDIKTLPDIKECYLSINFSKFKSTETRMKICNHVKENLSQEKFKPVTRANIEEYGKGKEIISEASSETYECQLAKSAADLLFEKKIAQ
jgi:hypothetical protein